MCVGLVSLRLIAVHKWQEGYTPNKGPNLETHIYMLPNGEDLFLDNTPGAQHQSIQSLKYPEEEGVLNPFAVYRRRLATVGAESPEYSCTSSHIGVSQPSSGYSPRPPSPSRPSRVWSRQGHTSDPFHNSRGWHPGFFSWVAAMPR